MKFLMAGSLLLVLSACSGVIPDEGPALSGIIGGPMVFTSGEANAIGG